MHVQYIHGAQQMLPYEACIEYIPQQGSGKRRCQTLHSLRS